MRTYIACIALLTACGTAPPAKSPDQTSEEIRISTFDSSPTETVGMVFEDKGDTERRDRTPPPTSAYKAQNKTALNKSK